MLVPGDTGEEVLLLEVQCEMKGMIYIFKKLIYFLSEGSRVGEGLCAFRCLLLLQSSFAVRGPG